VNAKASLKCIKLFLGLILGLFVSTLQIKCFSMHFAEIRHAGIASSVVATVIVYVVE
jgi:hypothetical protein